MIPSIPFGATPAIGATSRWRGALAHCIGAVRAALAPGRWRWGWDGQERLPIFRISRVWDDRWIVTRPGALIGHAFPDLASAAGFIRHESPTSAAAVELYIGDLYVVAFHDPHKPDPLFGEGEGAGRRAGR